MGVRYNSLDAYSEDICISILMLDSDESRAELGEGRTFSQFIQPSKRSYRTLPLYSVPLHTVSLFPSLPCIVGQHTDTVSPS